jgi:hypothetical protein
VVTVVPMMGITALQQVLQVLEKIQWHLFAD